MSSPLHAKTETGSVRLIVCVNCGTRGWNAEGYSRNIYEAFAFVRTLCHRVISAGTGVRAAVVDHYSFKLNNNNPIMIFS